MKLRSVCLLLPIALVLTGCQGNPVVASSEKVKARTEQRAQIDSQREQLLQIPPPAKSRYMTIRSIDSWENPYLTVQAGMLELHVTQADANTTPIGAGGMTRPVAARRQELNLSLDSLGEAMSAIPETAWPYGRVVAIEEAHKTPPSAEPAVRRAMELAIARLNDLGIVVYDPNEGKLQ